MYHNPVPLVAANLLLHNGLQLLPCPRILYFPEQRFPFPLCPFDHPYNFLVQFRGDGEVEHDEGEELSDFEDVGDVFLFDFVEEMADEVLDEGEEGGEGLVGGEQGGGGEDAGRGVVEDFGAEIGGGGRGAGGGGGHVLDEFEGRDVSEQRRGHPDIEQLAPLRLVVHNEVYQAVHPIVHLVHGTHLPQRLQKIARIQIHPIEHLELQRIIQQEPIGFSAEFPQHLGLPCAVQKLTEIDFP